MNTVISVENLSKQYDLGVVGTGTIARDFERWWAKVRGNPDPYTIVGKDGVYNPYSGSILALDDVSFQVQQGEALGIIGRNGAGKSTLLKILSRVTAPTSGVVKAKGRIGSLLEVGTGFHGELTGRENVFLNGAIYGMKKEEVSRKFDEIVAFSGVEKFIDTPVKRYSSGMYVRLGFAVAAHLDPEILIVDEVLAVGDAEFQKRCLGKMGDVTGEGRTILFVSHNMASVKSICKRGILLSDGRVSADDDINSIVNTYLTQNVRDKNSTYQFSPKQIEISSGFNFISVSILKPNTDEKITDVSLEEGFDVKIEYQLKVPISGMNIAFHLSDFYGSPIFTSSDVDSDFNKFHKVREEGKYSTTIHVSRDFLISGSYIIGVSASIPHKKVLGDYRRLFTINVIDTGTSEGLLRQKREGIINPILDWKTIEL